MSLFTEAESGQAERLAGLSHCNPFVSQRIVYERDLLGPDYVEIDATWHRLGDDVTYRLNLAALTALSERLSETLRDRLIEGVRPSDGERDLYEHVVLYLLYNKLDAPLLKYIHESERSKGAMKKRLAFFAAFLENMNHYFAIPGMEFDCLGESGHLFAGFFQIKRAFQQIFNHIIGGSKASTRLRAAVWESIFTCDMRRYRRGLHERMADITTLITGPSGTGKELVARAIGLSRFIPFDARARRFTGDFASCFHPVNLSAVAPGLIESELFGHARGAFTGAAGAKAGLFEGCEPHGTIFLDELGDLDPAIQVKLLRVLQARSFQRIGDPADRRFEGKIVAATNRDLAAAMRERRFREDLYYRLCADVIVTPSLAEQLHGAPEQLRNFLGHIAGRVAGEEEGPALAQEVEAWIHENLPADYGWPGNVRELEQCVRSFIVRRTYSPPRAAPKEADDDFVQALRAGRLTAEEVMSHYCTLVYAQCGNYQETARRLGVDGRTVKRRIDTALLETLSAG